MIAALLRYSCLLSAAAVLAVTLPVRGQMQPEARIAHKDCCANMPANGGDCGQKPAKPQDRHCCAACAIGLSLIANATASAQFSQNEGETLGTERVKQTSRFDRPPVPPPRA